MSKDPQLFRVSLSDDESASFLIRWRGRQEGPYTAAVIEAKLAVNEIGLLHEISANGRWITLRDHIAGREAVLRAERDAREEQQRLEREEAERQTRRREEQHQAELWAQQTRSNELAVQDAPRRTAQTTLPSLTSFSQVVPHRGGMLLTFALLGLFLCIPFGIAAWAMASSDLARMNAGLLDVNGRSTTSAARIVAILATVLWGIWLLGFVLIEALK